MLKGKVRWFNVRKGYGFIDSDDGQSVFVHKSAIKYLGFKERLTENQEVTFEVIQGEKGLQARNVRVVQG